MNPEQIQDTVIVMPAFNAEKTVESTLKQIPQYINNIVLCDDKSTDNTVSTAKKLGLTVLEHHTNRGYGGNQKTLYGYALKKGYKYVVMLHPDNQYDASVIPDMISGLSNGSSIVLGNRMHHNMARTGKMPSWKILGNRFLTTLQNKIYRRSFGEYHTGLRAYSAEFLQNVPYTTFSDGFVFDSEMLAYAFLNDDIAVDEIPVQCRYTEYSSSVNLIQSIKYGLNTLKVLFRFIIRNRRQR